MITIQNFSLKTSATEFTLSEWETLSELLTDSTGGYIVRYLSAMTLLGIPDDILDLVTEDELFAFAMAINEDSAVIDPALPQFITIGDEIFTTYVGNQFGLRARDASYIESSMRVGDNTISNMVAVCFRSNKTDKHYSDEEIARKVQLFKSEPAKIFIPFAVAITENLSKKINAVLNVNK
jgi:hypothetical protein